MPEQETVKGKGPVRSRIGELKALRDDIRVNIHLAGMDLRDEWHALEKKLPDPDRAAQQIKDLTADVLERLVTELQRFRARLQQDGQGRSIARFMSRNPATCRPSDSLAEAVSTMWQRDVGFLPVVDDAGGPIGTLTDRDACIAACTRGLRMDDIRVDTVMSRQVWSCKAEEAVEAASRLMADRRIRRVPVVADGGKLVGVITINDVARATLDGTDGSTAAGGASGLLATLVSIATPQPQDTNAPRA